MLAGALDGHRLARFGNISIIEGNDASQFGIGMVSARIAEIILRDEREMIPVGCFHPQYGTTFSLPSVLGRRAFAELEPMPHQAEHTEY